MCQGTELCVMDLILTEALQSIDYYYFHLIAEETLWQAGKLTLTFPRRRLVRKEGGM